MTSENRGRVRRIETRYGGTTGGGQSCEWCAGTGRRDPDRERAVEDAALADLRSMLDDIATNRRETDLAIESTGNGHGHVVGLSGNGNGSPT